MYELSVKTVGQKQIFQLDESEKILTVTTLKSWKKPLQQEFKLKHYDAEFRENAPELPRSLPLILSWCVVGIWSGLCGIALYFLLLEDIKNLSSLCFFMALFLLGPVPYFKKSLYYIFRDRFKEQTGTFLFASKGPRSELHIDYLLSSRSEVLELVEKISAVCRSIAPLTKPQERPLARCSFKEYAVELHQEEIKFFNRFGILFNRFECSSLSPEIIYTKKNYPVRNFICTYLALMLWVTPVVFIIWGVIDSQSWIVGTGYTICSLLPWAFGIYFWKKRRPDTNFYSLKLQRENRKSIDLILSVLKENDSDSSYFIEKLQKHLKNSR